MKFTELLKSVSETEAEGEKELVTTLKAAGLNDEAVEVAVAQFRIQAGFKDKLSKETFATVAKASGFEVAKAGHKKEEDDEEDPEKPGFFRSGKKMPAAKAAPSSIPADMPSEVKKAFEDANAALVEVKKEAAESKAEVVALRKEGERKEYIAKCAKSYPLVPGMSAEEQGVMLQKTYESDPELGKQIEAQWTATQAALAKSALLETLGRSVIVGDGDSPLGQIETIAKSYIVKDATLTIDQAKAQAIEANPALYQAYLAENPAQTGGR